MIVTALRTMPRLLTKKVFEYKYKIYLLQVQL